MHEVAFRHGNASGQQAYYYPNPLPYPTGLANAAFLDGHVEALDWKSFYRLDLSPTNASLAGKTGYAGP